MTSRRSFGSRRPSANAAVTPPPYQARERPFAESVSPIDFSRIGGSVWRAGSARSRLPPGAGGTPLRWEGRLGRVHADPVGRHRAVEELRHALHHGRGRGRPPAQISVLVELRVRGGGR